MRAVELGCDFARNDRPTTPISVTDSVTVPAIPVRQLRALNYARFIHNAVDLDAVWPHLGFGLD
jgi:hypothetical protein